MFTKKLHVAVTTIAVGLMLAGCAGGVSPSTGATTGTTQKSKAPAEDTTTDQSKADACAIVQKNLTEFSELSAKLDPTDAQAMVDQFSELSATSTEALNSITNAEIAPAATAAATGLSDYVEFLQTMVTDPSQASGLSEKITVLSESFTEVGRVCAG